MRIEQNVQVCDATGDNMKYKSRQQKNEPVNTYKI